jgi:hypothetical protein
MPMHLSELQGTAPHRITMVLWLNLPSEAGHTAVVLGLLAECTWI